MAKLSQLVQSKNLDNYVDVGLEKGEIWGYAPAMDLGYAPQIKWQPTGSGRAIVEVWGAGGSGARTCCCGYGIPGNSGAYARKTLCFTPSNYTTSYICGCIGQSCGNADATSCRGVSSPTCLFYTFDNEATTAVICAQGGKGGWSVCEIGDSHMPAGIIKNTPWAGGCVWCGLAYGGDINCPSNISCLFSNTHRSTCPCQYIEVIAGPPYQYSTGGACMMVQPGADNVTTNWSGGGPEHSYVIAATSRNPSQGNPWTYCWGSSKACGCYENEGCVYYTPAGHGGFPAHPCPSVRDHGGRGGSGAIRIRFVKDN